MDADTPPASEHAWPPREPPGDEPSALEPWRPAGIASLLESQAPRGDDRWNELRHIVVDELHEDTAGLVISAWPRVDLHGRLCFGGEDKSQRIATPAAELLELLHDERVVPVEDDAAGLDDILRRRELTVGDVFAAFLTQPPGGPGGDSGDGPGDGPVTVPPGLLLRRPVLDITAEARDAVKAQAAAAASGVIDKGFLELLAEEFREDEEPPANDNDPQPTPAGSDSSGGAAEAPYADGQMVTARTVEDATGSSEETETLRHALGAGSSEESGADASEDSSVTRRDKPMEMDA